MVPFWALVPPDEELFDPEEDRARWELLVGRLKSVLKRFHGTLKMHNFHHGLVSDFFI